MSIHHRRILNDIVELGLDPRKSYTAKELEHHRRAHDLRKAEHGDAHALGAIAEPFDNTVVAPLTVDDAHLGPIALRPLEQSNPVYTAEEIADREEHCRLMEEALAAEEAQTIADQDVLETPASANPAAVEPESVAKQPRNALVEKPAKNEKPARAGGKFVKKAKTEEPPAEG